MDNRRLKSRRHVEQAGAARQRQKHLAAVEPEREMRYTAGMSAADLSLVREFKRRAEQSLPGRVVRVMLYGSRARGDARLDSDWDIAVFVGGEPTPNDRHVLADIGFDLMIEQGQHVHAFAIDAASTPYDSYFVKNVLKDGLAA